MEDETYYVNVREPIETRKRLLETSRNVVVALQKYEIYKLKRTKKENFVDQLRNNFKEINTLIMQLKKELPTIKIKRRTSPVTNIKTKKKVAVKKGKRELEDLHKELKDIESKLSILK